MPDLPNSADIRQFLFDFFNDEELATLCFDFFPEVQDNFSAGMTKRQKILELLGYCSAARSSPTCWRRSNGSGWSRTTSDFHTRRKPKLGTKPQNHSATPGRCLSVTHTRTPSLPTTWPTTCATTAGACGLRRTAFDRVKCGEKALTVDWTKAVCWFWH